MAGAALRGSVAGLGGWEVNITTECYSIACLLSRIHDLRQSLGFSRPRVAHCPTLIRFRTGSLQDPLQLCSLTVLMLKDRLLAL